MSTSRAMPRSTGPGAFLCSSASDAFDAAPTVCPTAALSRKRRLESLRTPDSIALARRASYPPIAHARAVAFSAAAVAP
eukprot:31475-Pelagococcus_subviridis.AAC.14